jgi:ubiquitin-protein ligase E3 B
LPSLTPQVPFTLEQQRKITSALNTFVYNSFIQNGGSYSKPLTDVAVRCLNLLYERDIRHKFCPISLWLAPARNGRIPTAAAARAHEAAFGKFSGNNSSGIPIWNSVLTTLPHVYPFEERYANVFSSRKSNHFHGLCFCPFKTKFLNL